MSQEKDYIERLEKRVAKLQELVGKISPDALEQFNKSSIHSVPVAATSQSTPEWLLGDPAPRRFIRHIGSSTSPSPSPDDVATSYLMDDFNGMHVSTKEPRYFGGKSSAITLIRDVHKLQNLCTGKENSRASEGPLNGVKHLWVNPLDIPTSADPIYIFPPTDLIVTLINLYFKHVNLYLPLFHRPTFERAFSSGLHRTDNGFATTLILVCAVAAKYSDDPRVMEDPKTPGEKPDPYSSGWKWFEQVPVVKTTPLSPVGLYHLQVYVLVGQFMQASSVPQACWTVVGIGIRIAQDVGAHRRRSGEHTVENELWKRAFWVLVCMDRLFSSSTGRPCAINDEDFDVDPPIECDDEYWEHIDPKQRWRQPTPEKTPSVIVYFNVYIRLNQILAFLLRTVYATNKSRILHGFVGQQWEENIVAELDSALNAWMATLPDHLRWDPTRPNQTFLNQSASLFCFYQHVQILVHRPFIPSPQQPNKALSFPSLAICTNAARACSNVLDVQRKRYGAEPAPPPLTTTAFSAGVILLLSIWGGQRSGLLTDFDKEMADVKKCLDVLELAEIKWYFAGRLRDILRELAFVGDMPLPQRQAPPGSQKRERTPENKESDEDYVPTSRPDPYPPPRSGGRYRNNPEPLLKDAVTRQARAAAPSHAIPGYDLDYPRLPQQQQHPQHSSHNPPQYWNRQSAPPPPQKQYNTYTRPEPLQMQRPPESLPTFGQSFGNYSSDLGDMSSSYMVPRGGEAGTGHRHGYPYRLAPDGDMGMDMSMRPRAGDAVLSMTQPGTNVQPESYDIWSGAPPGYQCVVFRAIFIQNLIFRVRFSQWENYTPGGHGVPGQGQFSHQS
ncbi:hypothetical protein C0991_004035 [Blastosporella zonata]|nr:hypothetical protein C0991_004035 [Blastosporella zonata]